MLILGLLLVLVAAAAAVGAVYDGGDPATVELLGRSSDTTVAGVFFAGAATMLVFLLGVWLITSGLSRSRRKRLERKETKKRHKNSVSQLEQERNELRAENERLAKERDQAAGPPAGAAAQDGTAHRTDDTRTDAPTGSGTTTGGALADGRDDARHRT
jgi:ABC-type nickel/cobalt efflux system permease component RcnA